MSLATQTPDIVIFKHYDEVAVGTTITSAGRTIMETDVLLFSALTSGFQNAVHHNLPWIRENTEFRDRLFPGTGVLSYAIGLLSGTLAYRNIFVALLGIDEVRSTLPVYPGDTIVARATVVAKRLTSKGDRAVVNSDIVVRNQDDKSVMTYKYAVMVRVDPAGAA